MCVKPAHVCDPIHVRESQQAMLDARWLLPQELFKPWTMHGGGFPTWYPDAWMTRGAPTRERAPPPCRNGLNEQH
jgi:hypothetical protein